MNPTKKQLLQGRDILSSVQSAISSVESGDLKAGIMHLLRDREATIQHRISDLEVRWEKEHEAESQEVNANLNAMIKAATIAIPNAPPAEAEKIKGYVDRLKEPAAYNNQEEINDDYYSLKGILEYLRKLKSTPNLRATTTNKNG